MNPHNIHNMRNFFMLVFCALFPSLLHGYGYTETIDGITWNFDTDGPRGGVAVTGIKQGSTNNLVFPRTSKSSPVTKISGCNRRNMDSVDLPDTVVQIADDAFAGCSSLTNIVFPSALESVGKRAFKGCSSLRHIFVNRNLKQIDAYAFDGCDSLSILDIEDIAAWVSVSGDNPFSSFGANRKSTIRLNGYVITDLVIPSTVSIIARNPFENCTNIVSVSIPSSVITIGSQAFRGCDNLVSADLHEGLEEIGDLAFRGTRLRYRYAPPTTEAFAIPQTVKRIGRLAFPNAEPLVQTADDGVQWLGNWVVGFDDSKGNDTIARWRSGLRGIATAAFENSSILKSVNWPEGIVEVLPGMFAFCSALENVSFPEGVERIYPEAFWNCTSLKTINIPHSVRKVDIYAFSGSNERAFDTLTIPGCWLLDGWIVGASDRTALRELDFTGVKNIACDYAWGAPEDILYYTSQMWSTHWNISQGSFFANATDFRVGDGPETIPFLFSSQSALTNVVISGTTVTNIAGHAFYGCENLKKVSLSDTIRSIGEYAFYETGIQQLKLPNSLDYLGYEAFYGNKNLVSVDMSGSQLKTLTNAFSWCSALTSVRFPACLESIESSAFSYCSSLASLSFPNHLKKVGDWAFRRCVGLTSVQFSGQEESLGRWSFAECTSLREASLPCNLTSIGDYAFYGCTSLEKVSFPSNLVEIGGYAFDNCSKLSSMVFENGVRTISSYAFGGCSSLKTVVFPPSLEILHDWVFTTGCKNLSDVWLPESFVGKTAKLGVPSRCAIHFGLPELVLTPEILPEGKVGSQYSVTFSVTGGLGGAYSWSLSGFPSNFTQYTSSSSSVLTVRGNPLQQGHFPISIAVRDSVGTEISRDFDLVISPVGDSGLIWEKKGETLSIGGSGSLPGGFADDPAIQAIADGIDTIVVGDGVTRIGQNAFAGLPNVTTVILPETLEEIDPDAFAGCDNLEMLYLPPAFFDGIDRLDIPDTCNVVGTDVYAFAKRLYNLCLNREPDQGGVNDWSMQLASGANDGANVAFGFFMSLEMVNRNLSNEDFVEVLYNVMMNRASDAGGKAYWVDALDNGVSRAGALRGFAESAEFTLICGNYGINRGSLNHAYLEARDLNFGIAMFVARCYTKALGRAYDVDGLNYWCYVINASPNPRAEAIYVSTTGFFDSQEFQLRGLSNGAFVDVLYETFLGRAADAGGKAGWIALLDAGADRHAIMAGFYNSAEFNAIMASYGL